MKKIVVLGVGKQGSIVVNEMIKRKTEYVEFATAEDTSEIYKTLNNTDMIFIVFKALGKEQTTDLALKIAKEAKLDDILTIAVPISGNAEEEDIQKFKDVSDAIILSSKKFYQYPRRTYLDIEAIVSLIAQKSIGFDEVREALHNIGSVFIGVSYTEDCDSDSIHRAYLEARVQIPNKEDNYHNYIINISTDRNTSTDEINEATDKIDRICQQLYRSDTQTNMCGHVFDEKLDGVCRITLIVGMHDAGYRDYDEMLAYEYSYRFPSKMTEHIEKGLTEKEIVKFGDCTKLLKVLLREGLTDLAALLIISKGVKTKDSGKNDDTL